jgi:hypothetical protein
MSNYKKPYQKPIERKVKEFNKNGFQIMSPRPPKESHKQFREES